VTRHNTVNLSLAAFEHCVRQVQQCSNPAAHIQLMSCVLVTCLCRAVPGCGSSTTVQCSLREGGCWPYSMGLTTRLLARSSIATSEIAGIGPSLMSPPMSTRWLPAAVAVWPVRASNAAASLTQGASCSLADACLLLLLLLWSASCSLLAAGQAGDQ
jgi:hypothetical protein